MERDLDSVSRSWAGGAQGFGVGYLKVFKSSPPMISLVQIGRPREMACRMYLSTLWNVGICVCEGMRRIGRVRLSSKPTAHMESKITTSRVTADTGVPGRVRRFSLASPIGHPQGLYNYIYSFECTVSYVDFA